MDVSISTVFIWVMAAFYVIAGLAPLSNVKTAGAQYVAWGYPPFWVFVTAAYEVVVGALFISPQTRMAGALLGCLVMVAAIITVVRKREYTHAVPPVIVLILTVAVGMVK